VPETDATSRVLDVTAQALASAQTAPLADDLSRVLTVTAHPDDVDFGAAGTVASLVAQGIEVTYCICTDGDAGGFDPAVPRSEIPGIRRAEQLAAAKAVGVTDVRFLGYQDGRLSATQDLRRDISRVIRQVRPNLLIMQSPERNWDRLPGSHPDHLAAGEAAICAVYPDARNPWAHSELLADEGLEPWAVKQVWIMSHPTSDHFVDITDHFDAKLAALRAHESQTGHMDGLVDLLRDWGKRSGAAAGLPEGRLAESFLARTMPI
jgi:LmbE family N-acetylglucosaminyl deacetylase